MPNRIFNFSAGPAMLPTEVLEKSAATLLDYQGKGFGIAECSHRGKEFECVIDEATTRCKQLLNLGDTHDVLFLQGGATQLFTLIPMNFDTGSADYLVSGEWSKKAASFGKEVGKVNVVATSESSNFDHSPLPGEWKLTERGRLLPRLLQRDRPWPPPADLAEASEPGGGRQQRIPLPPAPGRRLRDRLRRRPEEPRPGRRGAGHRPQGPVPEAEEGPQQAVELQGPGREQVDDQHAADVRRVHPAGSLPLARSRRAAWPGWRSATPPRPA